MRTTRRRLLRLPRPILRSSASAIFWLTTCPRSASRATNRGNRDETYPDPERARPEPLARQHHARPADLRHAQALHRRADGDRTHLEPDDFRPRDQEQRGLRRGDPPETRGGEVG